MEHGVISVVLVSWAGCSRCPGPDGDGMGGQRGPASKYDECKVSQGSSDDELCESGEGTVACSSKGCNTINRDSLNEDGCDPPSSLSCSIAPYVESGRCAVGQSAMNLCGIIFIRISKASVVKRLAVAGEVVLIDARLSHHLI